MQLTQSCFSSLTAVALTACWFGNLSTCDADDRDDSKADYTRLARSLVRHPDNPVISYAEAGLDVEDPYNFIYKGKYYMMLEDRMDVASTYTDQPADPDTVRSA